MLSTCDTSSQSIRKSLQDDLVDFQETFAKILGKRKIADNENVARKWRNLVTAVKWSSSRHLLDENTVSLAYAVAHNVKVIGSSALQLERGRENAVRDAMLRIESLLLDQGMFESFTISICGLS